MRYSLNKKDYVGYGEKWIIKSDLTVAKLKQYGIYTSAKAIEDCKANDLYIAKCGIILCGPVSATMMHVAKYSISALKILLQKGEKKK